MIAFDSIYQFSEADIEKRIEEVRVTVMQQMRENLGNSEENILLKNINYNSKAEILSAIRFYEYIGEKDDYFLEAHNYSKEEVLVEKVGFGGSE